MKKTHTLLLALFLCLALIFPCALAEDAYVSGQRTQALIDAALDAGQVVGGETRLTLQLGDEILSMLADDEESQAQLDALMEVISGVRLAGGFGKLEDGYRVELGGSYTAPSGDNVFVTAAANLTLDGVSIESNLIEGERLSIRWETLLRLLGLTDDEVNQIMALRDVDWDSAMEELSTVVAQAAEEIGKLVEPYLATFADFLASLDIQQRDNVAAEGDYPAVDHEISVTCTAEDLGRLFHTLADQMERDNALLPYIEQLVANTTVTFTSDSGETTRTTTTAEFFDGMREFADSLMLEDATLGILVGYNDDGLPFYFTAAQTLDDETVVLLSHKKADSYIHIDVEFGEGEGKIPVDSIAKRAEAYKPKEKVTYKMIKEYIEAKYGFKVHTAYIAEVKRDLPLRPSRSISRSTPAKRKTPPSLP